MRLIVGVDIRRRSQGAVRFGTWLRTQLGPGAVELLPVHVLAHDELMLQLRRRHLSEVLEQTRAAVTTVLDEAGCGELGESLEVVQAMTPEKHLARMVDQTGADGLVIGRSALREDRALVRLGQVARRLARSLPSPVTIVPPDLEQSDLGDGPVLCAVSPDPGSLAAARAAFDLARSLGRGLCLLCSRRPGQLLADSADRPRGRTAVRQDVANELEKYPIHLGRAGSAIVQPAFTGGMEWYMEYAQRHGEDGGDGRLVALHTFSEPWSSWEVHPAGAEVVVCTAGEITLIQEIDGAEKRTTLRPGQFAINDPGVWHTADVEGSATVLFITSGEGTDHRPR